MSGLRCSVVPRLPHDRSGDSLPAGAGAGEREQESSRAWHPVSPSLPHVPSSAPALLLLPILPSLGMATPGQSFCPTPAWLEGPVWKLLS